MPARFLPQIKSYSEMSGAGKGALDGAAIGARIGLEGRLFGLLLFPITTTVGAVSGAIVGAVSADPKEEELKKKKALETESEIKKILLELKMQETMAKRLQEVGKRETDRDLIIFTDMGPSSPEDKPDYTPLLNQGIDVVLELAVREIGPGSFGKNADVYYFYMKVQARLVCRTESYTGEFSYAIGPPLTYDKWVEVGAEAFQKEVDNAYQCLAEKIIEFIRS